MATLVRRNNYPTDLSQREWYGTRGVIPLPKEGGRPAVYERRELLNALLYVMATACKGSQLPKEFGHWKTVYHYYHLWRHNGSWEQIYHALKEVDGLKVGDEEALRHV